MSRQIQNEDIKTEADITGAGGSASQLPNDTKIWVTANGINKRLDQAIADGDIGSGGGTTIKARASTNAGQSIPATTATIIDFGNITYDPGSNITTGASWKFTVPFGGDGTYIVQSHFLANAVAFNPNNVVFIELYKNGVQYSRLGEQIIVGSTTNFTAGGGSDSIDLAATDYIDVRIFSSQATTLNANDIYNYIAINKTVPGGPSVAAD